MAEHAMTCIAAMDDANLDYTMLWQLKHWDWLVRHKEGRELISWIGKLGLHRQEVSCKEFHDQVLASDRIEALQVR